MKVLFQRFLRAANLWAVVLVAELSRKDPVRTTNHTNETTRLSWGRPGSTSARIRSPSSERFFVPGARVAAFLFVCFVCFVVPSTAWLRLGAGEPLVSLHYQVTGTQLKVSPTALSVPKGIPGSVLVEVTAGSAGTNHPASLAGALGAHVEAILRGPGLPEARRLVGAPNAPLSLPPLNLVGDYQLDAIRLVESDTGQVRLEGTPASIPVRVFDEVLISKVVSRPLTTAEIEEKGIVIDEKNFRAVEFEVGFVLDGRTIPVKFPVVSPTFAQSTEVIPQAELEARLVQAALINQQLGSANLPPELEQSQLNIEVQGINFQLAEVKDVDLALKVPPIPALMVIPGNIGYLNQFFSVQIFTENAAPSGSALSVFNVEAKLILPPGPDRLPASSYDQPGDDPLRFARVGSGAVIQPVQTILHPGADGRPGTADDVGRLYPGESGQAEFLVEGLQEGLHVMDLDLTADLDGLVAGTVKIKGKAAGSVLVRNPKFSMAFTHPRTVRAGEPYEASVTILNTGASLANLVSVSLPTASLSGAVLESSGTAQLGTILPGQSATATFRLRAQRTGAISFSNLTTGDDSVQGRFRLRMGVDERGVALSPDTVAMPDFVGELPAGVTTAATRVLGQALSASTAALLPAGVIQVPRSIVTRRVLELSEAGQRVRYGDSLSRVLTDLLLDWQGGRSYDAGWDQILRETQAGREWREALFAALEAADALDAAARAGAAAADLAGRGETFWLLGGGAGELELRSGDETQRVSAESSAVERSLVYAGQRGQWGTVPGGATAVAEWRFSNDLAQAELVALQVGADGLARRLRWTLPSPVLNGCYRYALGAAGDLLEVDLNCDGAPEATVAAVVETVAERAPEVVSVRQDLSVKVGRDPCDYVTQFQNYGTVLAVLFSKPMTQEGANVPAGYQLDNGNRAMSVQIQPGGRVAILNLQQGVSALRPRLMTVSGVRDVRGQAILATPQPVQTTNGFGVAVNGRVIRADGSPVAGVPVTLTYYDKTPTMDDCVPFVRRPTQVYTDADGIFSLDFVLAGIPYSVSATDTSGLSTAAVALVLEAVSDEALNRAKLEELANDPTYANTLLQQFAVGAIPEAIARAEGLDRAVLRDLVDFGSARMGTTVPVALRFRGRATVEGRVLAADGLTPVAQAAVNLVPDPETRELARGMFTDSTGAFRFNGVPLGVFTLNATDTTGNFRVLAEVLDQVDQVKSIDIVLAATAVTRATLRGRVFEPDNVTPHAGARVFVGRFQDDGSATMVDVVAMKETDPAGFWEAPNIPAQTYGVLASSQDGRRSAQARNVGAAPGATTQVILTLNGRATVYGKVETSTGVPVANALVAGGEVLVRTDAHGLFTLPGVPTGRKSLSAGVERTKDPGDPKSTPAFDFPRLGSATLDVVAGVDNYVVIRLSAVGRIVGRVLDVLGQPVPNERVAIPQESGFIWVEADQAGRYTFEGMGLGGYTLSSPGPAVANRDVSGLLNTIRTGSAEEVLAAFGEALKIFTGVNDPFLNGEGANFNPSTWGFTTTRIDYDGQTVNADIRFLRQGTVSGTVLNAQGVPIGAQVRLTGLGPLANGMPSTVIRGEMNSDPALGTFEFKSALLAGAWGLQVASPFYPTIIMTNGQTTQVDPSATGIVLQFPAVREVNGRLAGFVFQPDGTPVGPDVNVKISFGNDYIIHTDTNGFYDTQIALPMGNYSVEAEDLATGFRGLASVTVQPGVTNRCDVRLLGQGDLQVTVRLANGQPATNATVVVEKGGFPGGRFEGPTDAAGQVAFFGLFEGGYGVSASAVLGPATISGRSGASVPRDGQGTVVVTLAPTATIAGTFLKRDLVTPVSFAQVSIGSLGFATTDANGAFQLAGVPLGTYRLLSQDPVSGASAAVQVTLTTEGEVRAVQLIEQVRGEIQGSVISSQGTGFVPGATVVLQVQDGLTPTRTVTTGPDGRYRFPATPAGPFFIEATDPISALRGSRSAVLPENLAVLIVDLPIQPLASMELRVVRPDGVSPATNAVVTLFAGPSLARAGNTDDQGRVQFLDLPLGGYTARASSVALSESRSAGVTSLSLSAAGTLVEETIRLGGVGTVSGRALRSDGSTPAAAAEVRLLIEAPLFAGTEVSAVADGQGGFSFVNVPTGSYRVTAVAEALAGTVNGSIAGDGEADTIEIRLGDSGTVRGRMVRADGASPVPGADVILFYTPQSGLPGRANFRTLVGGQFEFQNIPVGSFRLESTAFEFSGLAKLAATLTANGETKDLGDVRYDEADPRVVAVTPAAGATEVPTTAAVELLFSEAMKVSSVNANGVYLRSSTANVPCTLALLNDNEGVLRRVKLTPLSPLRSRETYDVVVVDGDRKDPFGNVVATGPADLMDRPLVAPFISRFVTADNDPPILVSIFPAPNAVQVDPRAIPRLSFNEPVREAGVVFQLTGPGGPVAGAVAVGLNGLVLNFTPTTLLEPNASYTLTVSNVFDLAGNRLAGEPFTATFATLDTVGPALATLRVAEGRAPVAGSTVPVEALLAVAEPGVTVRFSQDFNPIGVATEPPFRANLPLPASGSTTVRAVATDLYNNDGPISELTINVVSNQPPTVNLVRVSPADGPVGNGQTFVLEVSATDDVAVTNVVVVGIGALPFSTNFNSGALQTLSLTIPADAVPGGAFQIRAQAVDTSGLTSEEAVVSLEIIDLAPPVLSLLSPANQSLLDPGSPLELTLVSSDNGTNPHRLEVEVGSPLSLTQAVSVVAQPGLRVTNVFTFPLAGVLTNGTPLGVVARATDGSSNTSTAAFSFRLPDLVPPRLLSVSPTNGSVRVPLWPGPFLFQFSEAIATESVSTNSILFTNNAGLARAYVVETIADPLWLRVRLLAPPLAPGVTWTNLILPTLRDAAGNAVVEADGTPLPATGLAMVFTTAAFTNEIPAAGSRIVPGQTFQAAAGLEPGLGADTVRFVLNSDAPVDVTVTPLSTRASAMLRLATEATSAIVRIEARRAGATPFALPEIVLTVEPREGDADGDSLPNGYEADRGLDPFVADAAADSDGDGLTNLQEFLAGTDPLNPDSDGDSTPDGLDPSPLVRNHPPAALSANTTTNQPQATVTLVGSDPDHDPLSFHITGLPLHGRLFQTADGVTPGQEITQVPTAVTSPSPHVIYLAADGFVGEDQGVFVVRDGLLESAPAIFKVVIHPISNELRVPTIQVPQTIELVEGVVGGALIQARDADFNLRSLQVRPVAEALPFYGGVVEFYALGYSLGSLAQVDFNQPPTHSTNLTTLSYSDSSGPFWPGGPTDTFAVRARGFLNVPADGSYTFTIGSDDGSVLFLDGTQVVINDGLHGYSEVSATVTLTAGSHAFDARMFENGGGAVFSVFWAGPGFARRLITGDDMSPWALLRWSTSGNASLTASSDTGLLAGNLELQSSLVRTTAVDLVALDSDSLSTTQRVTVVVLPDLDRDGVADRDDPDIDGDGLTNEEELTAGTDLRKPDTDEDGFGDGADPFPLVANQPPVLGPARNLGLAFDGVDDFVSLGNPAGLQITGDQTIEFWIKPANFNNRQNPIAKAYGGEGTMTLEQNGVMSYFYGTAGGDASPYQSFDTGPAALRVGRWTHVALVRDLTHRRLQFYLDGVLVNQAAAAYASATASGNPITLGRGYVSNLAGSLDEVRVWNVARTPEQVAADLAGVTPANAPGLVGYWDFNEGSGSITADASPGANAGTLGGGDANAAPAWGTGLAVGAFSSVGGSAAQLAVTLVASDPDGPATNLWITALPNAGRLYQTPDGVVRGPAITTVPTPVTHPDHVVLWVPPRGVTTNAVFRAQASDGVLTSGEGAWAIRVTADPTADTDGDGLLDVYEAANGLDPEVNDAGEDPDGDGLANLQESLAGTHPREADTDGDGLDDGAEAAAGSNPLTADTDGDGLPDGSDPQPAQVVLGLGLTVTATDLVLVEGTSTNLEVLVESTQAPIALLTAFGMNPTPFFVTLSAPELTNGAASGTARAILSIAPLHDAAGTYTVVVRAVARDGQSAAVPITIQVQDDPSVSVTEWKDPVSGNWNDPARWTAGVPTADQVAVVAVAGTYTVNLNVGPAFRGLVVDNAEAGVAVAVDAAFAAPAEWRAGWLSLGWDRTLTLNQNLAFGGALDLGSRDRSSALRGSGTFENRGLVAAYQVNAGCGGGCGGIAAVGLPMTIAPSGTLRAHPGAYLDITAGGRVVALGGTVEVVSGGLLYLDNANPPRDLSAMAGSRFTGTGRFQINGASRFEVAGDVAMEPLLDPRDSSRVTGAGLVRLRGAQVFYGASVEVPLRIEPGASLGIEGAVRLAGAVTVSTNGGLSVGWDRTLVLDGELTNRGTLSLPSRDRSSTVTGAGRIGNEGVMQAYQVSAGCGGGCGGVANIFVPVAVAGQGRFLVDTGAWVRFGDGGTLGADGQVEVRGGGALWFENEGPARDLTLRAGSGVDGAGVVRLFGGNRLVMEGDATFAPGLELRDTSRVVSTGRLTLAGGQTLTGSYDAPVAVAAGATVQCNGAVFSSELLVPETSVFVVNWDQSVTVNGVLTNRGTFLVHSRDKGNSVFGSGRLENEGLIQVLQVNSGCGGGCGSVADFHLPVIVPATGRFLVNENAYARFRTGGTLTLDGQLEVLGGGLLWFENEGPARDLTLRAGSTVLGNGVVRLSGPNQILMTGNAPFEPGLELRDTSRVAGAGWLTLGGGQKTLTGTYDAPVAVAPGTAAFCSGAVFNKEVLVHETGTFGLNWDQSATIHGVLTNRGTFVLHSRDKGNSVSGSGRVENEGLVQVRQVNSGCGGGCGSWAEVSLLISQSSTGLLLVDANAWMRFRAGSSLTSAGTTEVQAGGVMVFESELPPSDYTLLNGAVHQGPGVTTVRGQNRLALAGVSTLNGRIDMTQSSQSVGTGTLSISTNGFLWFDHTANVDGSLVVAGQLAQAGGTVLQVAGSLTLEPGGVIQAPGTIMAGAFIDHGGTIVGNVPVLLPGGLQLLIGGIAFAPANPNPGSELRALLGGSQEVVLQCRGSAGRVFVVETSVDLVHWVETPAQVHESPAGDYRATLTTRGTAPRFFRLRAP